MERNMNIYNQLLPKDKIPEIDCTGILAAVVKENWNEDYKGMVKVEFFYGESGKATTSWVRVASPYTSNQAGIYFLPEVGSEVLVAFINGNRNEPVIIGSLWNNKSPIGDTFATEKNTLKTLKTKAGHELIFDEEEGKEQITIHTVGKLKINLADEKKVLTITDDKGKTGITIDFENGKIQITAEKEIKLSAGEKDIVTLDGKSAGIKNDTVNLEAGQALNMKGQATKLEGNTVNLKSDATMEAKAGASLKLEGSAMAVLKGGMVKIN